MRHRIFFTYREELWNSWSHAAGIVIGVGIGALFLSWCAERHDVWATWGLALYLFGMLSSYVASTTYHATSALSGWKEKLRKWDHAAIYWHIAGSYSPITLIALRQQGYWGWTLFVFIWLCAIAGTIVSFQKLKSHNNFETICYVGMGLSILVAFKPLLDAVGTATVLWIVAEGVAYITGALFYSLHKRRYMHTVFHFFVLAGTLCHLVAVWHILIAFLR